MRAISRRESGALEWEDCVFKRIFRHFEGWDVARSGATKTVVQERRAEISCYTLTGAAIT